jgi:hypothetical protein
MKTLVEKEAARGLWLEDVPFPVPVAYHTIGGWKRSGGRTGR